MTSAKIYPCPICNSTENREIIAIDDVPASIGTLWADSQEAISCPKGDIRLRFCEKCGMVWNSSFDRQNILYSEDYDNSLDFSPTFQKYSNELADRLVKQHELKQIKALEIGCGKGRFLKLLCERGNNQGFGFDPSYEQEETDLESEIEFHSELYEAPKQTIAADFVCCRHVLEHIEQPRAFLEPILKANPSSTLYFEVPDSDYILQQKSIWDIIYEHCNYFTAVSLKTLFERVGTKVKNISSEYGGQFLSIEALVSSPASNTEIRKEDSLEQLKVRVGKLASSFRTIVGQWNRTFEELSESNQQVVIWGAGAKTVSFANLFRHHRCLSSVIDINPNKHEKHIPGTGHPIEAPQSLRQRRPDLLLVMNPLYIREIEKMASEHGFTGKIRSIS